MSLLRLAPTPTAWTTLPLVAVTSAGFWIELSMPSEKRIIASRSRSAERLEPISIARPIAVALPSGATAARSFTSSSRRGFSAKATIWMLKSFLYSPHHCSISLRAWLKRVTLVASSAMLIEAELSSRKTTARLVCESWCQLKTGRNNSSTMITMAVIRSSSNICHWPGRSARKLWK